MNGLAFHVRHNSIEQRLHAAELAKHRVKYPATEAAHFCCFDYESRSLSPVIIYAESGELLLFFLVGTEK